MGKKTLKYQEDTLKLVIEEKDNSLVMSYANLDLEDVYYLSQYFIDKLATLTGQEYNKILNDLKEITKKESK